MKQAELELEQGAQQRRQLTERCDVLLQENAQLSTKVSELHKGLTRERALREEKQTRREAAESELHGVRDTERRLAKENDHLHCELQAAQQRFDKALTDASDKEQRLLSLQTENVRLKQQLEQLERLVQVRLRK